MTDFSKVNTVEENQQAASAFRVKARLWATGTEGEIVAAFGKYDVGVTDAGLASLHNKIKNEGGVPTAISYVFERYLIFRAKGVGGVYAVNPKGSGHVTRRTPGPINRHPAPIFDPIDKNLNELGDIAANYYGDEALLKSSVILRN